MMVDTISGNNKIILTYTNEEKDKYSKLILSGNITDEGSPNPGSTASGASLASGVIMMDYLPSTNKLFGTYRRKKYLYPELRDWRDYIVKQELPVSSMGKIPDSDYLTMSIVLGITRGYDTRDLDNFLKFLIDTICEYYLIDDNRFSKIIAYKAEILNSTTRWNKGRGDEYCFYRITPGNRIKYSLTENADKNIIDNLVNLSDG